MPVLLGLLGLRRGLKAQDWRLPRLLFARLVALSADPGANLRRGCASDGETFNCWRWFNGASAGQRQAGMRRMHGGQIWSSDVPRFNLRPGVVIPDWSYIAAEPARRALAGLVQTSDRARSWSNLPAKDDRVWQAVLAEFAAGGQALTAAGIAGRISFAEDVVSSALARLARRDLIVLAPDGDAIRAAYPFSAADVGYRVRLGARQVFALCAIDALGLGAMCGANSAISAACRYCAAPVVATTRRLGAELHAFTPSDAVVWCGLADAGGCAADSGCRVKTFFCQPAHLDQWRYNGGGDGVALSMAEAHMVGCAIFAPMRRPARDA